MRRSLVWRQWGRVLLFTLVPLYREMHRSVHAPRPVGRHVERARVVLRRLGA